MHLSPSFFILTPGRHIRVIIDDYFASLLQAQINSFTKVTIKGLHAPEPLPRDSPLRAWCEGPSARTREIFPPPGEYFDLAKLVEYSPRELYGLVVPLLPEASPNGCAMCEKAEG